MLFIKSGKLKLLIITLVVLGLLWGCKDAELSDNASLLEQCRIHLDEGEWSDAVDVCTEAGGDDGYHYAAQAYMGQGGLSLFELIKIMSNSTDGSGAASAIFSFVPDNSNDKTSFQDALEFLMGTKISEKSQTVYLEGLLVSSILVFTELKDVFKITESGGTFSTCKVDITDDADPAKCGFTVDVSADATPTLSFSGLGSTLYQNLCCNLDLASCTQVDSTQDASTDVGLNVVYDVTMDSCTIGSSSVLQYNKNAYDNFIVTEAFKSGGTSVLTPLDFYSSFDSGNRFDTSGDTIPLCRPARFVDITSDNGEVYDCEIIGAVFDPSSDLF